MDDCESYSDNTNSNTMTNEEIMAKGITRKSDNLSTDVKSMVQCVQQNKRSDKIRELDVECFRYDIYTRNQSGFITLMPILWALALENYVTKSERTRCRWMHKEDRTTLKITSSEISLYFNMTDNVVIIINYMQGFFMVKGVHFRNWINNEFPKVQKELALVELPRATDVPPDVAHMQPESNCVSASEFTATLTEVPVSSPPLTDTLAKADVITASEITDVLSEESVTPIKTTIAPIDVITPSLGSAMLSETVVSSEINTTSSAETITTQINDASTSSIDDVIPLEGATTPEVTVTPSKVTSNKSAEEVTTDVTPAEATATSSDETATPVKVAPTKNINTTLSGTVKEGITSSSEPMAILMEDTTSAVMPPINAVEQTEVAAKPSENISISTPTTEKAISSANIPNQPVPAIDLTSNTLPSISTKNETIASAPTVHKSETGKLDVATEIDLLWEKAEESEIAIKSQDSVMQQIINRCQNMELKFNDMTPDHYILKAEKSFDAKLTAFLSVLNSDIENKFSKSSKDMLSKINTVHSKMDKFHENTTKKIDDLINKRDGKEEHLQAEIDALEEELKDINLNDILNSISFSEEELKESISGVDKDLKSAITIINNNSSNLKKIEKNMKILETKLSNTTTIESENAYEQPSTNTNTKESIELLLCFDSNANYIDRKLLWKVKNSEMKRCGHLHDVSQVFESNQVKSQKIKYLLLNVGVNDLDLKDNTQVFGEMELLLQQVRSTHPGIKFIISEITPRKDARDEEVKLFNNLLNSYAKENADVTVAIHRNLRDPQWSMYRDDKHIRKEKIGKFAANLIRALKSAYGIARKGELYDTNLSPRYDQQSTYPPQHHQYHPHFSQSTNTTSHYDSRGVQSNPSNYPIYPPLMNNNLQYNDSDFHSRNILKNNKVPVSNMGTRLKDLANYTTQPHRDIINVQSYKEDIQRKFENFLQNVF